MSMGHQDNRQSARRTLILAGTVVVGATLFILGVDQFEMWLIVLVSYYAYWVLKMD